MGGHIFQTGNNNDKNNKSKKVNAEIIKNNVDLFSSLIFRQAKTKEEKYYIISMSFLNSSCSTGYNFIFDRKILRPKDNWVSVLSDL